MIISLLVKQFKVNIFLHFSLRLYKHFYYSGKNTLYYKSHAAQHLFLLDLKDKVCVMFSNPLKRPKTTESVRKENKKKTI